MISKNFKGSYNKNKLIKKIKKKKIYIHYIYIY
jgi:hypothetical protein